MAIFSGKVVSAQFIDSPNNMLIEVLYQEGDKVIPYVLEVDFTQQDFIDLLEDITLEEIEQSTNAQLEVEKNNLYKIIDTEVQKEIERRWAEEAEKIKNAYADVDSYAEKRHKEVEERYKEAEDFIKKQYQQIDEYAESKHKELDLVAAEKYKELDIEAAKKYQELDQYAEEQKLKKFEEVQEDFKKLRKSLQEKFSSDTPVSSKDLTGKDLLEIVEDKNDDNDFVFNMKVAVLEDPLISKSKDKALKLSLRKAKSVWQLMKIYAGIKDDS